MLNCDFDENPVTNGGTILKASLENMGTYVDVFRTFDNKFPMISEIKNYDGFIITGSRASVYEKKEWIPKLMDLIVLIDSLHKPVLGICFGFQATAQAFGGKVEPSGVYEEGFKKLELNDMGMKQEIFKGLKKDFYVYQSHGDVVTRLPEKSISLSESWCTEAFRLREFFCVQFHPEILPDIATKMAIRDKKPINEIMKSVEKTYSDTIRIISNFSDYCGTKSH